MSLQRVCLVHYHEIGLKGHNRSTFEKRLASNLKALLSGCPITGIRRISGRLCIFIEESASYEDACAVADRIAGVPGIARVSCGYRCAQELEEVYSTAVRALRDCEPFTTFKASCRRNHTNWEIPSMEMIKLIGAELCRNFPEHKVDVKNPEVDVRVEFIEGGCYVYGRSITGVGGLPVGSAGKAVCLLSSGIDSPVATWKIARRGATPIGVHFSGRPETSATSEFLVDDIAHVLERTGCIGRVYIVPIGTYQREIASVVPPSLRIIIYRRFMFRVAERIARFEGAKALVTGESLGQVASQTMDNIMATNAAVSLPIYRPLIGSDKVDIIADAEKLGTFKISSEQAADCCTLFMPRNPETHAKLFKVEEAEALLPDLDKWVEEAFNSVEVHDYACPSYKPRKLRKLDASSNETQAEGTLEVVDSL